MKIVTKDELDELIRRTGLNLRVEVHEQQHLVLRPGGSAVAGPFTAQAMKYWLIGFIAGLHYPIDRK